LASNSSSELEFALALAECAPDRYSASPLPSFCVVPTRRVPSFAETIRSIWRWLRGVQPNWRERLAEQQAIERLAQELDEGDGKEERKTKGKGRDGATAT
jgi:hypothetical protein